MCLLSTAIHADELDTQLMDAIKTACHGNLLDKNSGWLSEKLFLSSKVCTEIQDLQEDDIEYGSTLRKYKGRLTQEDLNRIYDPDYPKRPLPGKIELECTVHAIGERSGVDSKCQKTREMLAEDNVHMSLEDYRLLEQSCDYHHGCIDDYAEKWARGIRSFPPGAKTNVGGIELGDPTGEADNTGKTGASAAALTGNGDSSSTQIDLTDIYAGREQYRINQVKEELFKNNELIASRCQCVFNQASCFDGSDYDYDQLNQALASADARYESNKKQVCSDWYEKVRGRTSDSEATLNQLAANAKIVTGNLDHLDQQFEQVQKTLRQKETEIIWAAKQQQEAEDDSGFNIGKFAALSTGIILGGGLESLNSSELTTLVGKAALDSMEGVEGVSNLSQGVASIAEIRSDNIDQQNSIQSYSNLDTPAQTPRVTPGYYDALDTGAIESVAEPEPVTTAATADSTLCTPSGMMSPSNTIFWDGNALSCANGSAPVFGDGNWNYLSCPFSERKQASVCTGESLRLAGLASCAFRTQKAARVSCECVYSGENRSNSYCSKKAQAYL